MKERVMELYRIFFSVVSRKAKTLERGLRTMTARSMPRITIKSAPHSRIIWQFVNPRDPNCSLYTVMFSLLGASTYSNGFGNHLLKLCTDSSFSRKYSRFAG